MTQKAGEINEILTFFLYCGSGFDIVSANMLVSRSLILTEEAVNSELLISCMWKVLGASECASVSCLTKCFKDVTDMSKPTLIQLSPHSHSLCPGVLSFMLS